MNPDDVNPRPGQRSIPSCEENGEPAAPRPARVLVADDHALLRSGIRTVLGSLPDLEVVGEAADGMEAVELSRKLRPDLVLMDVGMPGMDGLEATREIKREQPGVSVLMFTAHPNPDYLLDALRAGASGYVLKTARIEEISDAVRRVLRDESPLDQGLTRHLLQRLMDEGSPRGDPPETLGTKGPKAALTARETAVLRRLAAGKTNRGIAHEMHLSLSTVKRHIERIIAKLDVSDRTQAAVRAAELGLLSGEKGPHDPED